MPTLGREDLLRSLPAAPGPEILFYSSGTTGKPKTVRFSPDDLSRVGDLCARFAALEGVGGRSRVMVLLPMALWTVGRITVEGHRRVGAQVFPVDLHGGVETWQRMADLIRPTVISSTPSVLAAWAPKYRGPRLELVETTGEPLLARERNLIEARFGAFVHDAYGLSECVVGTECRLRHGFHFWPDATGVEVLDPVSGVPLPGGETGELVLTSFMQERMPILRFRSGDLGYVDSAPCPCGCGLPKVHWKGRIAAILDLPRGVAMDEDRLASALAECAPGAGFRFKAVPESPAAPFVEQAFRPTLEILCDTAGAGEQGDITKGLFAALPELAELVHEGELILHFARREDSASDRKEIC